MDYDEVLAREMAPERVDERLDRLALLEGKMFKPVSRPYSRVAIFPSHVDDEVEWTLGFLEAIKPQLVLQPLLNCPNPPHRANRSPTSLWSAPGRKFTDLPLDVFLEVSPHLYPLDIINLSRTSKPLRSLLLSKCSRPIWTTALAKVVELPPRPHDMSEPLYAALVFDCRCFACGVNNAFSVDYALRVRMCKECYKKNVVVAESVFESLPSEYREVVGNVVLMLVPSANSFNFRNPSASTNRINPLSHLMQDSYFKPELEALLRIFWPVPEIGGIAKLRPLARTRLNYIMKRQAHAALVHGWDTVHCTVGDHAERLKLFFRFKRVFRDLDTVQLRGEDWDEATYDPDPAFFEYLSGKPLSSCPPEPVTRLFPFIKGTSRLSSPAELEPELPKPHDQLATEMRLRKARESHAHDGRICARYAQVEKWFVDAIGGCDDETPNLYDARTVWDYLVWADDGRGPLNDNVIRRDESVLRGVDEWLERYPTEVMNSLYRILKAAEAKPRPESSETAVFRPMALFRCTKCSDYGHVWPGINGHWGEKHRDESVWDYTGEFKAEVWEAGVEVAERILAVLIERGLGPLDRRMELDYLIRNGRLFCACGDPRMVAPDNGLNWVALVKHVFAHLDENARRTLSPVRPESEEDEAPVWIDDHEVTSCIKYLPRGVDTSEAMKRVRADPDTRARIDTYLSLCPEKSRPVCCLCEALTPDDKKDSTLFLQEDASGVLYHMQAKHGRNFEEKNLMLGEEDSDDEDNEPPPPRRKLQNVQAEFLEAIRPRPVLCSRSWSNRSYWHFRKATTPPVLSTRMPPFLDLPLDVFMEIASYLYPLDLIHLSRTSGELRRTLMSRNSRPIWTTSFDNVVELPPCPADLSEPVYAALVFDIHCFVTVSIIEGTTMLQSLPKDCRKTVGNVVLMLVPSTDTFDYSLPYSSFHRINPLSHLEQDSYFKPELEAILSLFWSLPTPENITNLKPFVRARVNYVMKRQAHAVLLRAWNNTLRETPKRPVWWNLFNLKQSFRQQANLQLHDSDGDEMTSDHDIQFLEYLSCETIPESRRHSSSSDCLKDQDQLIKELRYQGGREYCARQTRLRDRYTQMLKWYAWILEDYFSGPGWNHDELQNAYDGARLWEDLVLEDDARAPLDADTIVSEYRLANVFESLREYRREVMESLSTTLEAAELARVENQSNSPMKVIGVGKGWPEEPQDAVRHSDESMWRVGTPPVFRARAWEDGIEVVDKILAALIEQGISDKDVDKSQLDKLIKKGRVFCACGDPTMTTPDEDLTWEALVNHVFVHLNANRLRTVKTEQPDGPVWLDDHEIATCIKYLPRGADTSQATMRVRATLKAHTRFLAHINTRMSEESKPVCALYAALTRKSKVDLSLALPECANAVLYHMRAKHGLKRFKEKDVEFWGEWAFEPTQSTASEESDSDGSDNSE
ncbi:hypothetical protein V8D89_006292 [Ganoderma adspersum]